MNELDEDMIGYILDEYPKYYSRYKEVHGFSKSMYNEHMMLKNTDEDYKRLGIIIDLRYGFYDGVLRTYEEIGEALDLDRARVRWLDKTALQVIKKEGPLYDKYVEHYKKEVVDDNEE